VYQRRIPFLRMGRRILFKLSDLERSATESVRGARVPPP
jgi:hypothetical protein